MRSAIFVCNPQAVRCVAALFTFCLAHRHSTSTNCSTQSSIIFRPVHLIDSSFTMPKLQQHVRVIHVTQKIAIELNRSFLTLIFSFSERFQHYHYGSPERNMKVYGTSEPPPYNLSNVRTNVHLMHGTNDWLTPSNVSWKFVFASNSIGKKKNYSIWCPIQNVPLLANALGRYPITISKFPGYNHIDFAYGSNLDMVHRKILKVQKIFYPWIVWSESNSNGVPMKCSANLTGIVQMVESI